VFEKDDLDDFGNLPGTFNIEKYNFNPNEIFGNVNRNPYSLKVTGQGDEKNNLG
jgi:hypothetical protein